MSRVLIPLLLLLAACGGGDDEDPVVAVVASPLAPLLLGTSKVLADTIDAEEMVESALALVAPG